MQYDLNSKIFEGVQGITTNMPGGNFVGYLPYQYTTPKEELLAARESAWLCSYLSAMGSFDITGPDAAKLLNDFCINRDFSKLKIGSSRHAVMVDENGLISSASMLTRVGEDTYRTYCLFAIIPIIMSGQYNVSFAPNEIFIFQVDGPKSLQIIEKAFKADFHDLKFAQNKHVDVDGTDVLVHRLGMSGALAYELQGTWADSDKIYALLLEAGEEFGMKRLGMRQYGSDGVHTPGGFPQMLVHYAAPGWIAVASEDGVDYSSTGMGYVAKGSAKDDLRNYYLNPFEAKLDYLIDWSREFVGKAALEKIAAEPHRTGVTFIWDSVDVGNVYAAGFADPNLVAEPIDDYNEMMPELSRFYADKVLVDGKQVGVAYGRCIDWHSNRFISLGTIDENLAVEGTQVEVLWGEPGGSQYRIKATVAPMPFFNGPWRNETCDVMTMVPERPYLS